MKTKFKVGDVVIINKDYSEFFEKGAVCKIVEIDRHNDEKYRLQQLCGRMYLDGLWWCCSSYFSEENIITHDQFKSPLDGSWRKIISKGHNGHIATHIEKACFYLKTKTKRGLLNTLHRMNIQTRKSK